LNTLIETVWIQSIWNDLQVKIEDPIWRNEKGYIIDLSRWVNIMKTSMIDWSVELDSPCWIRRRRTIVVQSNEHLYWLW